MKIAILITCHNRRALTERCLDGLFQEIVPAGNSFEVWLVDDASTDGTAQSIHKKYPTVRIISGTGDLYWAGGMSLAWDAAASSKPDAFFWLNDDVILRKNALAELVALSSLFPKAILVGSCEAPSDGARTYGGLRRIGAHPGKLAPIVSAAGPVPCDTFEGNIVWIPAAVYQVVGTMGRFRHAMADLDYGYRAVAAGFPLLVAPGYLGVCARNSKSGTWEDRTLPTRNRLRKLASVKGLPPSDWWRFCRQNGGLFAPLYFITPLLRVLARR